MTLSPQHQDLLVSYLLVVDEVPPWQRFGRTPKDEPRLVFLSRDYLCHLATGGRALDPEDLILAEMLLAAWVKEERGEVVP